LNNLPRIQSTTWDRFIYLFIHSTKTPRIQVLIKKVTKEGWKLRQAQKLY